MFYTSDRISLPDYDSIMIGSGRSVIHTNLASDGELVRATPLRAAHSLLRAACTQRSRSLVLARRLHPPHGLHHGLAFATFTFVLSFDFIFVFVVILLLVLQCLFTTLVFVCVCVVCSLLLFVGFLLRCCSLCLPLLLFCVLHFICIIYWLFIFAWLCDWLLLLLCI